MAVTGKWYGQAFKAAFNKEIDLDTDVIKMMLCTSSYTPNQDTHVYKSDVTNEITGTGYTAGGLTLTSAAMSYDAPSNTWAFDAADPSWGPGASFSGARYGVVYDSSPATDATRPLILYIDFGADQATTGGSFGLTFQAAGIATIVAA